MNIFVVKEKKNFHENFYLWNSREMKLFILKYKNLLLIPFKIIIERSKLSIYFNEINYF